MSNSDWLIGDLKAHLTEKPRSNPYFREGLIKQVPNIAKNTTSFSPKATFLCGPKMAARRPWSYILPHLHPTGKRKCFLSLSFPGIVWVITIIRTHYAICQIPKPISVFRGLKWADGLTQITTPLLDPERRSGFPNPVDLYWKQGDDRKGRAGKVLEGSQQIVTPGR